MSYSLKTLLANSGNYGGKRTAGQIRYIVIHYTANDGDTAVNNARYFANNVVKASAHYFVDDTTVYRSVPDLTVAWAVGGSKYRDCAATGGGTMYGKITNTNSISIELCDTLKNGVYQATEATMANAAVLCGKLMQAYNLPVSRVYRHFDVNGKHCPAYLMDSAKWEAFKARLTDSDTAETTAGDRYRVATGGSRLLVRSGPGTNYARTGERLAKDTVVTVDQTAAGAGSVKGWAHLPAYSGWASLDYLSPA